jgi:hypothetical protein
MRALIAEEKVVPLICFGAMKETSFVFLKDGKRWQSSNPVVTLLHDSFSRLHHRLLAVHYGKLMEYQQYINSSNDFDSDGAENTEVSDCSSDQREWISADVRMLDHDLQDLLANYRAKFNSTPIPYPEGALELVDLITKHCAQGCLMITAAPGITSETEMRLTSFADLTKTFHNHQPMPVNFHLLAHKLKKNEAVTDCLSLQKDQVIQIALLKHSGADARLGALVRDIEPGMFGHATALSQSMKGVNGDSCVRSLVQQRTRMLMLRLMLMCPFMLMFWCLC